MKGFTVFAYAVAVILMGSKDAESMVLYTNVTELLITVDTHIKEQGEAIDTFMDNLHEDLKDLKDLKKRIYEKAALSPATKAKCKANHAAYCVDLADTEIKKIWERTEEKINICINITLESANKHVADMEKVLNGTLENRDEIKTIVGFCYTDHAYLKLQCTIDRMIHLYLIKFTLDQNNTNVKELTAISRKRYVADYEQCLLEHATTDI